ncbi:hypothetical protein [Nonomuraea turcica]|uniref:hypothetical protein n=1 Tax=Nonomuraea sp. G32 TaxID=3067274 RepID=UPI00273AAA03|nr:hypothetical protein [Nonomuraea sp. G32]MDP4501011.1 hypothetical protein [Nonomuraea sp. G32]
MTATNKHQIKCGEKVDLAIKGVRLVNHPSARLVRIADEHGDVYDMPPQTAITRAGKADDSRVASILSLLDSMEAEGYLQPYVAAAVRKEVGLPPRHWPPQAGDVWDDGIPFGGSLWFAREYPAKPDDPDQTPKIGMVFVAGGISDRTPQGLLESAPELKLVYRHKDGDR